MGQQVRVVGWDFAPNTQIVLYWNYNFVLNTAFTDSSGQVVTGFNVPGGFTGNNEVEAWSESGVAKSGFYEQQYC